MKLKLPCCEINQKEPDTNLECDHCECVFDKKELLDDHNREIHEIQFTGKRKLCCEWNEKKNMKTEFRHHSCYYCECAFQKKHELDNHMRSFHKCSKCGQIVLTEDIRAQHEIKHEEEKRKRDELEKQQQQKDDNLILNYVKTNKLDECQSEPDYEPDWFYIFSKYRLDKNELLRCVKIFGMDGIHNYGYDNFTSDEIIFLLENEALCFEEIADYLDGVTYYLGDDDIMSEMVAYFLDKDYEIKREWVAKAINDNELMERIKQKYTYTFDEIHKARQKDSLFNKESWDHFYVQVHKHFPDPEFEDPFADPYIDFECVSTDHVRDHLQNRYFYDEEEDKLSIVVGWEPRQREISLGSCKKMLKKNLQTLIERYYAATEKYDKANEKVSNLFEKREEDLDEELTENQRLDVLDYYHNEIYKDALPERNFLANTVSKLYFVISKK